MSIRPNDFCLHRILLTHECKACKEMNDSVDHPPHYTSSNAKCECGRTIECIDVTRHMSFNLGNVIKYIWRHEQKEGLVALKKARWYLEDQIKHYPQED